MHGPTNVKLLHIYLGSVILCTNVLVNKDIHLYSYELFLLLLLLLFGAILYDCKHGPTTCTVLCY